MQNMENGLNFRDFFVAQFCGWLDWCSTWKMLRFENSVKILIALSEEEHAQQPDGEAQAGPEVLGAGEQPGIKEQLGIEEQPLQDDAGLEQPLKLKMVMVRGRHHKILPLMFQKKLQFKIMKIFLEAQQAQAHPLLLLHLHKPHHQIPTWLHLQYRHHYYQALQHYPPTGSQLLL